MIMMMVIYITYIYICMVNDGIYIISFQFCFQTAERKVCSTVVFAELHWTPGVLLQVLAVFFFQGRPTDDML